MRLPSDLPPRAPKPRRAKRRLSGRARIVIAIGVGLLVVLFLSARGIAGFYTDYLWYDALGYRSAFTGVLGAKIALATIFTLGFAALCTLNLALADRSTPVADGLAGDETFLERYQSLAGGRVWALRIGVSLLFGLIAGLPAAAQWQSWLLFTNAQSFGVEDAQFGQDVGFYVFRLPFLTFVVDWLFAAFVVILIITAVAHYLNGGIRLQVQQRRVSAHVKLHLSVLLAVLALLRAVGYWLQRYELTTSNRGFVEGAGYTDVNAQLPAIELLAIISVLAAVLLIVNVRQRGWRLPVIAVGLWGLVAVVAGTIYPAVVQRFQVQPAESRREQPYIDRNIQATSAAFGLDEITDIDHAGAELTEEQAEAAQEQLRDVRLLEPTIAADTFQRQQGLRTDYVFNDVDVDRYDVNGRLEQVMISARELNLANIPQRTWEGRHLAYTHGYGVAMAPAGRVTQDGFPVYLTSANDPSAGVTQPALYFGEGLDEYSVVATERDEVTIGTGAEEGSSRYQGTGGVKLDSRIRRAAFALRFGEYNLFGSGLITEESRILYVRNVRDRVKMLAPFLHFDADPYPVVLDDGRIVWVVDGYTTTGRYPYSATADTTDLHPDSGLQHSFNYVRNSVKATVDAYNGDVDFYVVDPQDPIIRAWQSAFPKLFQPQEAAAPALQAHFRYPEDQFRVQTNMYALYHVKDPAAFFQGQRFWNVAPEPPAENVSRVVPTQGPAGTGVTPDSSRLGRFEPYYTMLQSQDGEREFVLLRPFVPVSEGDRRQELVAFMTVSGNPESYGRLTVYRMQPSDGALPEGPLLVDAGIKETFNRDLTLEDQQGSTVRFGDMQVLPIDNALAWVRPWYVQANSGNPLPRLRSVTVTVGRQSDIGPSLEGALRAAFPGATFTIETRPEGANTTAPPEEEGESGGEQEPTDPSTPPTSGPEGEPEGIEELLARADQAYSEAQDALADGDVTRYIAKLEEAAQLAAQAASLATGEPVTATTEPEVSA
jgi:uncharacterized membrane protein (UPF0182 family)